MDTNKEGRFPTITTAVAATAQRRSGPGGLARICDSASIIATCLATLCMASCKKEYEYAEPEYSTEDQLRAGSQPWRETFEHYLPMAEAPHVAERPSRFKDWQTVIAFVHISDIQLRDFGVKYFHAGLSRKVSDEFAPDVERLASLDKRDEIPALTLVGGLLKLDQEARPSFVLHTGDALDAGTVGEMVQFTWILNQLPMPWFSAVGNHDVFLMGNFTHDCLTIRMKSSLETVPLVADRDKFMLHHGPGSDWPYAAAAHQATENGNRLVPGGSRLHGFDVGEYNSVAQRPRQEPESHYSFPLYTEPPIRVVVLDTNKTDESIRQLGCRQLPDGHEGFLGEDAKVWLQKQIEAARKLGEYVIVAGHHPLAALNDSPMPRNGGTITKFLADPTTGRNVLAYLGGHTHSFAVRGHERGRLDTSAGAEVKAFPEIISTATRVDPSFGLLIEILRKGDQLAVVYRSIAPRASGELGVELQAFCEAAAKESKSQPKCDASKSGGFIVATGVKEGPRTSASWADALPTWRLVDTSVVDKGTQHGPGSSDERQCGSNDTVKTEATVRIRHERDRVGTLTFEVGHPDVKIVHQSIELPDGASVVADIEVRDTLDPDIPAEHQRPVIVGRRVTVKDVPARAVVRYEVELCAAGVRTPEVK